MKSGRWLGAPGERHGAARHGPGLPGRRERRVRRDDRVAHGGVRVHRPQPTWRLHEATPGLRGARAAAEGAGARWYVGSRAPWQRPDRDLARAQISGGEPPRYWSRTRSDRARAAAGAGAPVGARCSKEEGATRHARLARRAVGGRARRSAAARRDAGRGQAARASAGPAGRARRRHQAAADRRVEARVGERAASATASTTTVTVTGAAPAASIASHRLRTREVAPLNRHHLHNLQEEEEGRCARAPSSTADAPAQSGEQLGAVGGDEGAARSSRARGARTGGRRSGVARGPRRCSWARHGASCITLAARAGMASGAR